MAGHRPVWLNPIFPSPMADFGYDITDHEGVDPLFGTLADLERLVALGVVLVLVMVPVRPRGWGRT